MQRSKFLKLFTLQCVVIFTIHAYLDIFKVFVAIKFPLNELLGDRVNGNAIIIDTTELSMSTKEDESQRIQDFNFSRALEVDKENIGTHKNKLSTERKQNKKQTLKKLEEERQSQIIQDINCAKIIQGDEKEIGKSYNKLPKSLPNDTTIIDHTKNCKLFRQVYGYNDIINTQEEKDFPLAFNILFYKEVAQVEMLLRSIYRPQNSYCLHADGFSPNYVHRAAKSLADCFPNVFIVSKTENIIYTSFQRLQADINCMADHLKLKHGWKYLLNLPGEEFPIKTNLETVRILKVLNNTNSIECIKRRKLYFRYGYKYIYNYKSNGSYTITKTANKNPPPPHNIEVIKGSAYGVFTRAFVHYVVHNQTAKDLLNWCRGVLSPDEYFWPTLQHNPHLKVPGRTRGRNCNGVVLAAFVNWGEFKCHGRYLRDVCVFNSGDLEIMRTRKEIFANKFKFKESYAALQCLEKWIIKKTHSEQTIDQYAYRKWMGFIKKEKK